MNFKRTIYFSLILLHFFFNMTKAQVVPNFNVLKNENPSLLIDGNNFSCSIDSFSFINTSTGPITSYLWKFPGGSPSTFNGANPPKIKFNTKNIDFIDTISLTIFNGPLSLTKTFRLRVLKQPKASFFYSTDDQIIPAKVNFTNTSSFFNVLNKWDFGDGNSSVSDPAFNLYSAIGEYNVCLVVSKLGVCFDTACEKVLIVDKPLIKMPNVFTPDDDNSNTNELFRPSNLIGFKAITCNIYDRWGNIVYTWEGLKGSWDGFNSGGLPCSAGTYFYRLSALSEEQETIVQSGYVQLVR